MIAPWRTSPHDVSDHVLTDEDDRRIAPLSARTVDGVDDDRTCPGSSAPPQCGVAQLMVGGSNDGDVVHASMVRKVAASHEPGDQHCGHLYAANAPVDGPAPILTR